MTKMLSLMFVVALLSGCADTMTFQQAATATPVGFWYGLWHGVTFPFSWIGSLFWDDIAVYAIYNNGGWYDFGFFEVKGFKKGTGHFKFKSQDVWAKFNQRIAKLKGYPLPQHKKQAEKPAKPQTKEPEILFSIKL